MSTTVLSLNQCVELEVGEQLARVLADELFVASRRSSRFLRYVVEQTLAGKAAEVKEIVIAAELYTRADDYDPKSHSTVRVEATRLRARLQRYYAERGGRDPVWITLPKGTYVPRFERATPTAIPAEHDLLMELEEGGTSVPPAALGA